jgi:NAD(P)-dependent dehydrogenase (short-subunit alcohol dehydrogenase family)
VILAARNVKKGEEAVKRIKAELGDTPGARQIEFMSLDLSSFADVKVFADEFKQKNIPLDMLILNAGVMAPAYGLTKDGFETQIGTNHFGHFLLVKCFTPLIKSSKTRVVHVSSVMHAYSYPEGIRFDSFSSGDGYDPM